MEQNGLGSMLRQAAGDPGQERAEGAVDPQEGFQVKATATRARDGIIGLRLSRGQGEAETGQTAAVLA